MIAARRGFLLGALALAAMRALAAGDAWARLRGGGLVILMRDTPRQEARRVGARLRDERVPIERVYTSPSAAAHETAMLAFGSGEEWDPLRAFVRSAEIDDENTEHVRKRIAGYTRRNLRGNVAMVTQAENIASLTRRDVATGELLVVRPDGCCGLRVVDQLKVA